MNYFSGVYIPDTTSGLLGGHCVKIVGWGEDTGMVCCSGWLCVLRVAAHVVSFDLGPGTHAFNPGVPYWTVANSWGAAWGGRAALRIFHLFDVDCRRKRLFQDSTRAERLWF